MAECEAYARPARTTRSLRAPRRHDFDARAFTRALYAVVKITPGPQTCSRATVGSPALSIRSTASLPPRPQHAADATRRYPTLFRPLQPFASEVETEAGKVALYAVECAPEIGGEGMGVMQDDRRDVEPLREVSTATKTNARPFRPCRDPCKCKVGDKVIVVV